MSAPSALAHEVECGDLTQASDWLQFKDMGKDKEKNWGNPKKYLLGQLHIPLVTK